MSGRRPPQAPATDQHGEHSAPRPTAAQARRELARRRLPRAQRTAEQRAQAIEDGTFRLTREALLAIAEGAV